MNVEIEQKESTYSCLGNVIIDLRFVDFDYIDEYSDELQIKVKKLSFKWEQGCNEARGQPKWDNKYYIILSQSYFYMTEH